MTNPYSGKAVDVDRVLLARYPGRLNLRDLAGEACVSPGQAYNVTRALIDERIAIRDSTNNELKLMAPLTLLKRLASTNSFATGTKFLEYYTPEESVSTFLKKFKKISDVEYAFTGLTGAMLVAPFVRPTNVHVYVNYENDPLKIAQSLNIMPIEKDGNVKFAIPKSRGVFYETRKVSGVNVVSDIQIYIDLLNYPPAKRRRQTKY